MGTASLCLTVASSVCFVLQLLGAAFLGIGLWAWAEKVSINTCTQTHTGEVQHDCFSSITQILPHIQAGISWKYDLQESCDENRAVESRDEKKWNYHPCNTYMHIT